MEQITENNQCTGCAACANICPHNAISIIQDKNGFYRPHIDQNKCTNCRLCKKTCPSLNYTEMNLKEPKIYALMAKDDIRKQCASGGAFSLIAEWILAQNGYVAGAAFNNNFDVEHIIINNQNDLNKLKGSKYVQSKISENLFRNIKELLEKDTYVLFSGCPCQVAGLKHFLQKDYEKLILVDIYCTYAPSQKVYKKYIDEIDGDIENINFRDKELAGWSCSSVVITKNHKKFKDNKYMKVYHSKLAMSETCEQCKYATLPRQSDITLADFWGIKKFDRKLDDKLGTSIYMINTQKGEMILSNIKTSIKRLKEVPLKYARQRACEKPFKAHRLRNKFYKLLETNSFTTAYEKTIGKENNIGIMNFWYVPNRGAILTNYAINEFLKENGYNPKTINYYPRIEKSLHKNSISEKFEKEYLETTSFCQDYIDLKNLNNDIRTFLVGSDQVFRDWCIEHHRDKYFLNFADDTSKKISCSASFGIPSYDGSETNKTIMQKYLQRFDALSVRENSGVDILKNTFNLTSTQIWDPVFYIDRSKYEKIAETSSKKESKFLAYYIITMTPEKKKAINFVADKLGLKPVDMKGKLPVEDWLYYIKNCEYYIGDSFHGTCFALMFQKNFLVISPRTGENDTRLDTLLETVDMQSRQLQRANEIYSREDLLKKIDYTNRFEKLNSELERSKTWLLNAIEAPKISKEFSKEDNLFFAQMDRLNTETAENTRRIILVNNKNKLYVEYLKCGIFKKLIFNKKRREHYKTKYRKLSAKMKELKSLNY